MSKLITAKINVSKIDKDRLFKGSKGTYLDLTIWVNDTPDKFGNDISIEQRTKKGEDKIFLGEGKFFVSGADTTQSATADQTAPKDDDLPF